MRRIRNSVLAGLLAASMILNVSVLFGDIVSAAIRAAAAVVSMTVMLANDLKSTTQRLRLKEEELAKSQSKIKKQKADFKKIHSKAKRRLAKIALVNVGAVGGEMVPLFGIPIIIGTTLYEVAESCKLAQDLANMARVMGIETSSKEKDEICGLEVPFRDKGGKDAEKHKEKLEQENKVD